MRNRFWIPLALFWPVMLPAQEFPPPAITNFVVEGPVKTIEWNLAPAMADYTIFASRNLNRPFGPDSSGSMLGNTWSITNFSSPRFWKLQYTALSSNELLTANVLNRIAYGPTPDDLDRLAAIGPQAYLDEQMAPASLPSHSQSFLTVATNGVNLPPDDGWTSVSVTGRVSSSTLYMYLREPGELYLDDVQLRLINTIMITNMIGGEEVVTTENVLGPNVLVNGDFEAPLTTGWNVSANMSGSSISSTVVCTGSGSLHMVASTGGSTRGSSIFQDISPELPTSGGQRCLLSFNYQPSPSAPDLTIRLSGRGTIISGMDEPDPIEWTYATATGRSIGGPRIYLYIDDFDGTSQAWVDNVRMVEGDDLSVGPNLVQNGDFESALTGPWILTSDFAGSFIDDQISFEGSGSLRIVATGEGSGGGDSVFQTVPVVNDGETLYTVGYWYRPATPYGKVIVRLSGAERNPAVGMLSKPAEDVPGIERRLEKRAAELEDLRAWHVRNAVHSKQQLLEILLQFLENHFVTEHSKSYDYMDRFYSDDLRDYIATDWEYRENQKWRECLLRPDCTFFDLLKVSAESPAMIVYLDTVDSRGDGGRIANENYARELFELFCNGVDNGYDQNDIVAMSRAWTGWSVEIVDKEDADNPFADRSETFGAYPGNGYNNTSNRVGVWTFNYKSQRHGANRAPIFSVWDPESPGDNPVALGPKQVPDRFGPPWAGTTYQLNLPARTGTNSIQDGYDVLQRLADIPFTMEYISVKLCRLFVHDDFVHGVYDYTDPDRSPEVDLVHQCMVTWASRGPAAEIWAVLDTIFQSDLFRSHAASMQKVKTPLEYAVSAVRALRTERPDGSFTASTDGYSISGRSRRGGDYPLIRMGSMLLFDRADPDGYPESGPPWISAGTLAERVRFVQSFLMETGDSDKDDDGDNANNLSDPVSLMKMRLPFLDLRNDRAVARFFLGLLYPGEGLGNLNHYEASGADYLNTAENGLTPSPFRNLDHDSEEYDRRVRGMVALLMSFQRFHEQ